MKRADLPSLLLLPFPPDPSDRQLLSAAYRPSLAAALSKLKSNDGASQLIVAVACPVLHGPFARSKTISWPEVQSLVADLYKLISTLCAHLAIPTELDGGPGSVDATILLLDHDRQTRFPADFKPSIQSNSTIVVDLPTFARAYHPWNNIFHVRSELGLQLYQTYLRFAEGKQTLLQDQLIPVEGGLTMMNMAPKASPSPSSQTSGYSVVCLGGTFDYLHPGHKLLLTAAAMLLHVPPKDSTDSCLFIIGVTGDELLKNKKYAELVQSWEQRARNVIVFLSRLLNLSENGWKYGMAPSIQEKDGDFQASFREGRIRVQCVKIQDPFGPTITVENVDALVVSGETRSGGQAVNDKRAEQGWRALQVYEVDVLDAEDISDGGTKTENFASKISSSVIRQQRAQAKADSKI